MDSKSTDTIKNMISALQCHLRSKVLIDLVYMFRIEYKNKITDVYSKKMLKSYIVFARTIN